MKKTSASRSLLEQHLDETDFLVVDVETTGLSPDRGDRVCEIAAVKLRGGAVVDSFSSLIDPQRPISAGAYAVNRISPQMLVGAPTFCEIAERLWSMMDGAILVAYNAPFDVSFLTSEFQLCGFPALTHPVADALAIARQLLPGLGRYPQENVANVMGIPFPVKHRALEDTMVTAQLFTAFLSMLKAYDCTTCADLNRKDLTHVLHEKRLNIIERALSSQHSLWLKYLSPTENEITQRMITPKECIADKFKQNGAMYLIAYCHSAKAERNFRIDRMLDIRVVPPRII